MEPIVIEDEDILGVWFLKLDSGGMISTLLAKNGVFVLETYYKGSHKKYLGLLAQTIEKNGVLIGMGNQTEAINYVRRAWEKFIKERHVDGWELVRGIRSLEEFQADLEKMPHVHIRRLKKPQKRIFHMGENEE